MSTTKWSNATVTSEGLSLQAELLNGGGIEFTRVMGADANGDDKIELTMQPTKLGTAKITIPVLLSNIELTEGFTMTQLRFYAKGTGGAPATEILYAVVQDEDGDQIPSASESPGFTADWSYTFQFGNAESMTVSLDPAGLISLSMVGQPNGVAALDANGQVAASQLIAMLQSASVALAYDDESTYEEGDYCTRDGQLYKANADIATAETWDASHWTAVNVMDLIAALTGEDIPTSASDPTSISSQLSNKANGLIGNVQSLGYTKIFDITENGSYLIFGGPSFLSDYPEQLSKDGLDYCVLRVTNGGSYTTYDIIAANASSTEFGFAFGFRKSNGVAWRRAGDTTPPQVRNLTLQSGFSADNDCTFFVTQENTVFLSGGVSGTLPANQDTQIGTLPADASPAAQRRRPAETNAGVAYIDIHTDGTVWAHPFATASQCWFDASFVAGGGS